MQGIGTEFRIVGPPGTGKTTTLARQVAHDVERYGSEAVLVASLTRAAAAEIGGRELPLDRHRVGTLHAHAYRALGHPPLVVDKLKQWNAHRPDLALSGAGRSDVDEPVWDQGQEAADESPAAMPGDWPLAQMDLLRARMVPPDEWPPVVTDFAVAWGAWKQAHGYLDFTDLIEHALAGVPEAPGAPAVLIADETQDYSALEMALCRAWAERCERFYAAGDPDQAIYEWRGADPHVFRTPALPPERTKVLAQSYRVPRAVHARAVDWVERIVDREPVTYRPRDAEGEVRRLPAATWKRPQALVRDIEAQLDAGREVMVLASCSYMLAPTIALLRREGIPFHNPYRKNRGDWNPLQARGTSGAARVLALLRPDEATWGEEWRFWTAPDLRSIAGALRKKGVLVPGGQARLDALTGTEDIGLDVMHSIFEEPVADRLYNLDLSLFEEFALADKQRGLSFPLAVARARGGAALREPPRVVVGTIHSTKGGESPVVYLFPDVSQSGYGEWLSAGERRNAVVRLFYVGMTRAREELVLCGASGRGAVPL